MDPSALKWHDWAKDEVQLQGKKDDLVRSPPRSISSSTSTLTMTTPPPPPPPLPPPLAISSSLSSPKSQHQEPLSFLSSSDKNYNVCAKPTREELKEMMPDPIHCFCNQQAHLLELEEVGPVLVCYRWANEQDPVMCGFHMHQDGWLQFRHELEAGLPLSLDHSGLRSCKHFNYSFCTYFFVCTSFPKLLDNGPTCFCNKPLLDHHYRTSTGCFDLQLRCEKMYTNQKRCNFQISARNVLFLKSACHPIMVERKREERLRSKTHAQDLLSALLAKTDTQQKPDYYWEDDRMDTYSSGDSSLSPKSQTPTTLSPTLSHRSLFQNMNCQNTSAVVFKKKNINNINNNSNHNDNKNEEISTPMATPPPTATEINRSPHLLSQTLELYELQQQEQQLELEREEEEEEEKNQVVVMVADDQQQQPSTLPSPPPPPLLATLLSISPTISEKETWESEKHQLKVELDRLQQEINMQNRDTEYVALIVKEDKLQQELERHEIEHHQNRYDIERCDKKRVTKQCTLTRLELQLASSKEREDEENLEKAGPKGEDFKCKLCFNRYIEYALIPCYHLAYCETCANRLKECAICRKSVTTMIKINMC